MSITIALTEEQRSLLQLALEIARDKFQDNVRILDQEKDGRRLADQFERQTEQADELLLWIAGAENVIIEEARD
jgi:hypothetical protein